MLCNQVAWPLLRLCDKINPLRSAFSRSHFFGLWFVLVFEHCRWSRQQTSLRSSRGVWQNTGKIQRHGLLFYRLDHFLTFSVGCVRCFQITALDLSGNQIGDAGALVRYCVCFHFTSFMFVFNFLRGHCNRRWRAHWTATFATAAPAASSPSSTSRMAVCFVLLCCFDNSLLIVFGCGCCLGIGTEGIRALAKAIAVNVSLRGLRSVRHCVCVFSAVLICMLPCRLCNVNSLLVWPAIWVLACV